jgi:hypothetical protein
MTFNIRAEFTNIFNRSYWTNPSGTNAHLDCTDPKTAGCLQSNGNTNTGFGKLTTTGVTAFGTTNNLLPRQGVLVGRFTF